MEDWSSTGHDPIMDSQADMHTRKILYTMQKTYEVNTFTFKKRKHAKNYIYLSDKIIEKADLLGVK